MMIFFFKGYGNPRNLPSSPARRTSDPAAGAPRARRPTAGAPRRDRDPPTRARRRRRAAGTRGRPARVRSEEHTSELQSRQYLVCRLLLEKKKILIAYVLTLVLLFLLFS